MNTTYVPATQKQVDYIASLIGSHDLSNYALAVPAREVANGTRTIAKTSASTLIKELLALPPLNKGGEAAAAAKVQPETTTVPEGRYAVEVGGVLRFYQVDRPTEGKWKGYTFVKVQASDDLHPVKNREARAAVLAAIAAAGPKEASIRYGIELGVCGRCGRTLTDEASRAAGIGPVCAEKGW